MKIFALLIENKKRESENSHKIGNRVILLDFQNLEGNANVKNTMKRMSFIS
jgi:hypothetical protein